MKTQFAVLITSIMTSAIIAAPAPWTCIGEPHHSGKHSFRLKISPWLSVSHAQCRENGDLLHQGWPDLDWNTRWNLKAGGRKKCVYYHYSNTNLNELCPSIIQYLKKHSSLRALSPIGPAQESKDEGE